VPVLQTEGLPAAGLPMRRAVQPQVLVRLPVRSRSRAIGPAGMPGRHVPRSRRWPGWMMRAPGPGAPAIEHLELHLWRMIGARGPAIGERRFRLIVRLVVRHWPTDTLERIRKAGHWRGAERKRVGRILAARVRESAEALDDGMAEAWPIILDGTVGLLWAGLCDMHHADQAFRDHMHALSLWVARHGARP